MSMVSKTSYSHFSGQGSYVLQLHMVGLNFTMKSRAESLELIECQYA